MEHNLPILTIMKTSKQHSTLLSLYPLTLQGKIGFNKNYLVKINIILRINLINEYFFNICKFQMFILKC